MDTHELLRRVDLRGLAEEAGANFRGKGLSSHCPLHEGGNPNAFHLYRANGVERWHCFTNCPKDGNDGDAISFVMRWKGLGFKEAIAMLSERTGMAPSAAHPERSERQAAQINQVEAEGPGPVWVARAEAFVAYAEDRLWESEGVKALGYLMEERGLCAETIRGARLGWNPKDWKDGAERWGGDLRSPGGEKPVSVMRGIVVPTLVGGRPVFVNIRRPLPGDSLAQRVGAVTWATETKYMSIRGGVRRLFGVDGLRGMHALLLTEGEFDCLLAWQECGDMVDVATIGGARMRLRMDDAVYLLRAQRILAAYDGDEAGRNGAESLAALSERVTPVTCPYKDVTEVYLQAGAMGLRKWLSSLL